MELTISFTPAEEMRLAAAARQSGIDPAELVRQFTLQQLSEPTESLDAINAKLREWQQRDGVTLFPDVPASQLFAQWAEEDAQMTAEEREAEDRLWQEIEAGINANRAASGIRPL